MANEYIIPIGFDFKGQDSLKETISTMEMLNSKGGDVGKTMNEEFSKGAKAVEEFEKKVKPTAKTLESVSNAGKVVKANLENTFEGNEVTDFQAKIEAFKERLASINANIDIDIPDDKLRIYEAEIAKAKDGTDELRVALLIAGDVLQNLDPNSEEYKVLSNAVTEAGQAFEDFGGDVEQVINGGKSMKAELRQIKAEMNQLENSGQAGGQAFRELAIRAGELEDQIGDTDAQIRILASDTKNIDGLVSGVTGLVGAFTLAQGAVGLFAEDNEKLQEALLKVNSAMAILQGLQAVQDTLNKDSAFSVIYLSKAKLAYASYTTAVATALGLETTATGAATVATKLFSIALISIGIGLVLIAIAALVEYWDELTEAVQGFLPAGVSIGKQFDKIKSVAFGVGNAIFEYVIAPFKILYALLTEGLDAAVEQAKKSLDVVENYASVKRGQDLRNEKKYLEEAEQQRIDIAKRSLERRKNQGEKVDDLILRNKARQVAFNRNTGKKDIELEKELQDDRDKLIGENRKKAEENAKKSAADSKKRAEENAKKAEENRKANIEAEKKANAQIKKFTEELEDAKIRNIEESGKRQREEIEDQFDDKINSLKDEVTLTKEAKILQSEIILELEKEKAKKLSDFDQKVLQEKLKIQLEAEKELVNLKQDSLEKELESLNISAEETKKAISEKYKNEEDLKLKLLEASEKTRAEKEKEIIDKYAKQKLKDDEERAILGIELMSTFAEKSTETEIQKQIAIQQIKLDFANQNLKLLLDSGKDENDIEVLRAKKIVNDTNEALNDAIKKNDNKPFDLLTFLGLDKGLTSEQKSQMKDAFNAIGESLGQLTDFMVEQYDRQIQKKQESIDQIDEEIGSLEEKLDEEKDLREQGFANNVEIIEAEIEEKKIQREEEIRQQEEFMKKKQEMQRLQMVADTAVQLVNLITASTEIFKNLSPIPFIGVPLAITTIGLMFGAFAAAKISAFQSINSSGKKFKKGGQIDGNSHESGGVKYYSSDGKNIELEGKEFVFSKEKRQKYGNLLDAMNFGNFNDLSSSDAGVVELFKELGFDTNISGIKKKGQELQISMMSIGFDANGRTMSEINQNIRELLRLQKETPTSYSDGFYNYLREGDKVIKTKLKQLKKEENEESEK